MPFLFISFDKFMKFVLLLEGIAVFVKPVFKYIFCKTVLIDSIIGGILFQIALVY